MNVIILAGGLGSRLWPLSNAERSKPLLCITDGYTLIQKTFIRAIHVPDVKEIIVLTNSKLFLNIRDNLSSIKKIYNSTVQLTFIIESENNGTCAAIALAALYKKILDKSKDEMITIMPSDHVIEDDEAFYKSLKSNINLATQNKSISILAVKPESDDSSYGYILANLDGQIVSFIEKPDILTINKIRSTAGYSKLYWNTGIFSCSVDLLLEEMQQYYSSSLTILQQDIEVAKRVNVIDNQYITIKNNHDHAIENVSIDKIIMENSKKLTCFRAKIKWSDIGCWKAIFELNDKKEFLKNNIILHNSQNCYIKVSSKKTVACVGIKDVAIIDTDNALLITDLNSSQNVRSVYEYLETRKL